MSLSLTGRLIARLDKKEGTSASGKEWVSRTIVVETEDQYPQEIAIDFFGAEKVKLLETLVKDQEITVHYNLRGSKYKDRWFVSLGGWKIEGGATAEPEEKETATDEMPY